MRKEVLVYFIVYFILVTLLSFFVSCSVLREPAELPTTSSAEDKDTSLTIHQRGEEIREPETLPQEPPLPREIPTTMTFEVAVPENTPEGDTVWIYVRQIPRKMEKIDDYLYRITLNNTQLFGEGYVPEPDERIGYRYSRNGYNFRTAEYLEPTPEEPDRDTDNYFWTKQGREIVYGPGKIQQDVIERWRWFPTEGMVTKTTRLEPSGKFLPRVHGLEFRSGQTIEDLYVPAFFDFFNSTARHMKNVGYTWVELEPPWQWREENGLPNVINDINNAPNYPDDETFLEELRAYKREGLNVLVAPQICCTPLDTNSKTKEWWDVYFDEMERFLVHFAALAEQGDADAFMYAVPSWGIEDAPVDIGRKWRNIFSEIRAVFHGEVGQMIWVLGPDVSPSPKPIPDTRFVTWGDKLDFFLVATEFPLSPRDNPTDEELRNGAGQVIDGIKEFYDEFKKPIIIRNGYFNVKYSWKGQTFYEIDSIPWISDPEAALQQSMYEFNTEDQARVVNAYFQAIAERPWVVGYFHFGYTHWEDPLSPWMSIRGKPAEDLWGKWNKVIYET